MVHIELFHHFLSSTYGFLEPEQATSRLIKDTAVKHAVTTPFLMHQLLAFAARHRSSVCPDRDRFFRRLAAQLQGEAISLFGRVDLNCVTPAERVSIFLFSSFLGFQDLCETLAALREEEEDEVVVGGGGGGGVPRFDAWMERYMRYVHLHRGVHKVISGSWPELRGSELRPLLEAGEEMFKASGTGGECDDLRARIAKAERLSAEDKVACCEAIRHLQWVFDGRPVVRERMNVLLAWVPMLPDGFVRLLERGCNEAFCVLAYYFVLLHFCRDVWFVSGSGEYLLKLLDEYLGPEWEEWMVRPKELIKEPWG